MELRQHYSKNVQRFLLCAYCFGNGGARTIEQWSARWLRSAESVSRKIWGRNANWRAMQNTDPGETWWGSCTGGFWCSPEKLPVGVVVYRCSTLRDLHAIKQMAILHLKTAHKPTPVFGERRLCATTRRSRDVKSSKLVYNITHLAISWVVRFWACPMSQTSPEDGGVFIGNDMWVFCPMAYL